MALRAWQFTVKVCAAMDSVRRTRIAILEQYFHALEQGFAVECIIFIRVTSVFILPAKDTKDTALSGHGPPDHSPVVEVDPPVAISK